MGEGPSLEHLKWSVVPPGPSRGPEIQERCKSGQNTVQACVKCISYRIFVSEDARSLVLVLVVDLARLPASTVAHEPDCGVGVLDALVNRRESGFVRLYFEHGSARYNEREWGQGRSR